MSTAKAMRPSTKVVSPFTPRADRLRRHVTAVDDRVAGEHAQRSGVAGHLDVSVLEDILVAVETLCALVQTGERLHLLLDLVLDLPGQVVAGGLLDPALAQDQQDGAFNIAPFSRKGCPSP